MMILTPWTYVCMETAPILSFRHIMALMAFPGQCSVSYAIDLPKLNLKQVVARPQLHLGSDNHCVPCTWSYSIG